jgi:hypothetical protein
MRGLAVVVQIPLQRATRLCIRCWPERALPMSLRGPDNPANEERESSHALPNCRSLQKVSRAGVRSQRGYSTGP